MSDHLVLDGPPASRAPEAPLVGMVVWLASELMFFSGLFAAWFTLRANADVWPSAGADLAVARTGVATAVLLASSVTMHLAVVASRRDDRAGSVRWLLVTAAMGAVFITNQGVEYATASFHVDTDAFGSIFYLMTGFHGLHVIGGLILLLVIAGVVGGRSKAPTNRTVEMAASYWHFVDAVWVAMFSVVYLLQ